jgi:hypothetical protein
MGKAKKEHRKRVQKRNQMVKSEQNKVNKLHMRIIEQIKQEQEAEKFRNNPSIPDIDPIYIPQINLDGGNV